MGGKLHFICNGIFGPNLAGGDFHFLKVAVASAQAGYEPHYIGGDALQKVIELHQLPGTLTLTDERMMPPVNQAALRGQLAMLRDFYRRYRRTLSLLENVIKPEDYAYAVSDYWFDALPMLRCSARRKLTIKHLDPPTLWQIVTRGRPDVDAKRLAALHVYFNQRMMMRKFLRCPRKRLVYVNPGMKPGLLQLGFREEELVFTSVGVDVAAAEQAPTQEKQFDAIWIGRVHRQKGIEDLLATLAFLAERVPNFRAVLVGQLETALRPRIEALGLKPNVVFTGLVADDAEKFRLFKSSRVFLMPSNYESWGIVIAESLACGVPVVAYDIAAYRPVFGDLLRYVPPFDLRVFQEAALDELNRARAGRSALDADGLAAFKREHSWQAACERFVRALDAFRP